MALEVEGIVDGGMDAQKALRRSGDVPEISIALSPEVIGLTAFEELALVAAQS